MTGFFASIFDSFSTEKCSCADCLYSSDCTLDKSIGCGTFSSPLSPESRRVDDEAAVYEAAFSRARELVSENSPEFEPLVNRLIEQGGQE